MDEKSWSCSFFFAFDDIIRDVVDDYLAILNEFCYEMNKKYLFLLQFIIDNVFTLS